jgi:hypothetical protein
MAKTVPNGSNLFQMVKEYLTFSIPRPFKIYPNLDFWFKINHLATLVVVGNESFVFRGVMFLRLARASNFGLVLSKTLNNYCTSQAQVGLAFTDHYKKSH